MKQSSKRFEQCAARLGKSIKGRVSRMVGMKRLSTFKIGGLAEVIVWPAELGEVQRIVELAAKMELPWRVLGAGSNLLVLDGGVHEVLVNLKQALPGSLSDAPGEDEQEAASGNGEIKMLEAGAELIKTVKHCQTNGLSGIEWAAGIPGTVGGAVKMNAGSLESSMSEVVEWVEWARPGKGIERVSRKDLDFKYRRLDMPGDAVVTACGVRLFHDEPRAIKERIVKGLKWRRQNQPLNYPSAGSVFKNPEGDHAARLIEEAGLKGERINDAQFSEVHANFIVNRGRARSRDVTALIDMAKGKVSEKFNVDLELEIEVIGEELS